jgi:deoxyribodipyrimidine photo-lyase
MSTTLVWLRADLRTRDNHALFEACRTDADVIAVFLISPEQWREHDWGAPRVDFVLRNLQSLSEELRGLGIPLLIRHAPRFHDVPRVLLELARERDCEALFYNREYEVNERERDHRVEAAFDEAGIRIRSFEDQTVIPPDRVRTKQDTFYKVFTPFKRAWLDEIRREGMPEALPPPSRREGAAVEPDPVPAEVAGYEPSHIDASVWPARESEAGRRLDAFAQAGVHRYDEQRDLPALDGTSALSPYLACGVLSPRQCLAAAADANTGSIDSGSSGVTTWVSELIWREFYRHVLVGFPHVCKNLPFDRTTEAIEWSSDDEAFDRWCAGTTGVPIVDAGMRQLHQTGWMHNRLRMIVAMYLSKNLFIDWRRGERYFMQKLVDGDLANNNGGWQWSASTGCDAAPYFRMFNPVSQSKRYDPQGKFIRRYCPELAQLDERAIHDPSKLPDKVLSHVGYPRPMIEQSQARLRVMQAFKRIRKSKG